MYPPYSDDEDPYQQPPKPKRGHGEAPPPHYFEEPPRRWGGGFCIGVLATIFVVLMLLSLAVILSGEALVDYVLDGGDTRLESTRFVMEETQAYLETRVAVLEYTNTPSYTPSVTSTLTPSVTARPSVTPFPTRTPTNTNTPRPPVTRRPTETLTYTPSSTFTPTATFTASNTPTDTDTPTITPTFTPTNTFTPTPTFTNTATFTPSYTPTRTDTPTATNTPLPPFEVAAHQRAFPRIVGIENLECLPLSTEFRLTFDHDAEPNFYYYEVTLEVRGADAEITDLQPIVPPGTSEDQMIRLAQLTIGGTSFPLVNISTAQATSMIIDNWNRVQVETVKTFTITWYDTATQPNFDFEIRAAHGQDGAVYMNVIWAELAEDAPLGENQEMFRICDED